MFGWYKYLTPLQRRTFWACWGGWGLDAMDFQLYFFVIPTLIGLWHMSAVEAGFIATGTLLAASLGGWIAGILGDRFGRARVLMFTVIWYAGFTFLCGFAQTPLQLGILRALVGLGFGGEWAVGAIMIGEIVRPQDRGRAVGCVQSAYGFGWAAAALSFGISFSLFEPAMAWRVLFWVGLIPVFVVIIMRSALRQESAHFERVVHEGSNEGLWWRVIAIFSKGHAARTLLACLMCVGLQGGLLGLLVWLPTFLKNSRGLSVVGTTNFSLVITVGSIFGFLAGAWLVDAIGRRKNFMAWAIICCVTMVIYLLLPVNDLGAMLLGLPLGFVVSGIYGGIGAYLTELFPTQIRGTAQSFAYNVGRTGSALVPPAIGALSSVITLPEAIAVFSVSCYLLVLVAVLFLPETKGVDLAVVDERAHFAKS